MTKDSPPNWWTPRWAAGDDDPEIPPESPSAKRRWQQLDGGSDGGSAFDADGILAPLEASLDQVRSRERVRDLAEVFTHEREVGAILDSVADAFDALDVKFLEPACGAGNFLVEILRRKLRLVTKADSASQEHYEHRLLRAVAAVYGVDISPDNVAEARGRMAHVLLDHYQTDANTVEPTAGFLNGAAVILGANIVCGDTLADAHRIEVCDWRPSSGGRFQRVWSYALVPPAERDLFWAERTQDTEPVHYAELRVEPSAKRPAQAKANARR